MTGAFSCLLPSLRLMTLNHFNLLSEAAQLAYTYIARRWSDVPQAVMLYQLLGWLLRRGIPPLTALRDATRPLVVERPITSKPNSKPHPSCVRLS